MYSLSDLTLYSRDVWLELLATYNASIWPAQLVAAVFGIGLTVLVASTGNGARKVAYLGLGLCWLFVAVAFHHGDYTAINWMAHLYALLFIVQGILLIAFGLLSRQSPINGSPRDFNRIAVCAILIALVAVPATGLIEGHTWNQLDYFGVAPDSTVLVTVGFLLAARRGSRWWLLIIPVIWILISFVHSWPLGMFHGLVLLLLLLGYLTYFLSNPARGKVPEN